LKGRFAHIALLAAFELTSTATDFHLRESLHAKKGDQEFFTREQVAGIKRDLV